MHIFTYVVVSYKLFLILLDFSSKQYYAILFSNVWFTMLLTWHIKWYEMSEIFLENSNIVQWK